jgi:hypothetical protein
MKQLRMHQSIVQWSTYVAGIRRRRRIGRKITELRQRITGKFHTIFLFVCLLFVSSQCRVPDGVGVVGF